MAASDQTKHMYEAGPPREPRNAVDATPSGCRTIPGARACRAPRPDWTPVAAPERPWMSRRPARGLPPARFPEPPAPRPVHERGRWGLVNHSVYPPVDNLRAPLILGERRAARQGVGDAHRYRRSRDGVRVVTRHVDIPGHEDRVRLALCELIQQRRVISATQPEGTDRDGPPPASIQFGREPLVEAFVDHDEPGQARAQAAGASSETAAYQRTASSISASERS